MLYIKPKLFSSNSDIAVFSEISRKTNGKTKPNIRSMNFVMKYEV